MSKLVWHKSQNINYFTDLETGERVEPTTISYGHKKQFIPEIDDRVAFYTQDDSGFPEATVLVHQGKIHSDATFTRSSSGTYVGSDGLIHSAANYEPRFEYDPVTGEYLGLLSEGQRTNLFTHNTELDNAAWSGSGQSVIANAAVAPDGTTTMDKIVEDTSTGSHYLSKGLGTAYAGTDYAVSIFVKPAERTRIRIAGRAYTFSKSAIFDVSTGSIISSTWERAWIEEFPNGVYRCSVSGAAVMDGIEAFFFYLDDGTSSDYTGDGSSGLYAWGLQLEKAPFPSSLIYTTSAQVTRSYDYCYVLTSNVPDYVGYPGTFVCEANWNYGSGLIPYNRVAMSISAISGKDRTLLYNTSGTYGGAYGEVESTGQFTLKGSSATNKMGKIALAFDTDDIALIVNGAVQGTDNAAILPTADAVGIGFSYPGNAQLLGHIKSLTYYPARLSNTELEALTS